VHAEESGKLLDPEKGEDATTLAFRRPPKREHYSWACVWAEIKFVLHVQQNKIRG